MPGLKAPTCAAPGGPSAAFAQRPCQNAGARAHTHTRGAGKSGIGHSPCKRVERNQRLAFSPDLRPGWKHPPHPSVVVVSAFVFRSIAAPARLGVRVGARRGLRGGVPLRPAGRSRAAFAAERRGRRRVVKRAAARWTRHRRRRRTRRLARELPSPPPQNTHRRRPTRLVLVFRLPSRVLSGTGSTR